MVCCSNMSDLGDYMKEKINQFAKGIFEYSKPDIVCEPSQLQIEVEAGGVAEDSFTISNTAGRMMKGMVRSFDHEIVLEQTAFQGESSRISMRINAVSLQAGQTHKGAIHVYSDLGEKEIPFVITAQAPGCHTSAGVLRDLYQFTALAQKNYPEAERLFFQPEFERVFLSQDEKAKQIYRGLLAGGKRAACMEEFLAAMHQKTTVRLSADTTSIRLKGCCEESAGILRLQKDTWGLEEYEVLSDAPFIRVQSSHIKTTDFIGNAYELEYIICPQKMTCGRNYGQISIRGVHQTLQIKVYAQKKDYDRSEIEKHIHRQQIRLEKLRLTLEYRQGKLSQEEYQGSIEKLGDQEDMSWQTLWVTPQTETEGQRPQKQLEQLKEMIRRGSCNPLVYQAVCDLYSRQPDLLLELDEENAQCLHWGCRQERLNQELLFRYTFLIGRYKGFSQVMLEDLYYLYEKSASDEVLLMICKMLMRDRRIAPQDARWYALGIEHNLKLTDLYEHYLYAVEEHADMVLPQAVLTYFSFHHHLNHAKEAMLYAYIVRHKRQNKKDYESYYDRMLTFALSELKEGRINENLVVLYEEFFNEDRIYEETAKQLPAILFGRRITCTNPMITGVYVRHPQLQREEYIPLYQGEAVVTVFSQDACIFLTDVQGNRYTENMDYTVHRLVHLEHLADKCYAYAGDDIRLLLYLYRKTDSMHGKKEERAALCEKILQIPDLTEDFYEKVYAELIRYYFDEFEGAQLDQQLQQLDWSRVLPEQRHRFMEYCAIRHCDAKALEGVRLYGYEQMEPRRLLQMLTPELSEHMDNEEPVLVETAWYIFEKGKFDETLLKYLGRYFTGSIEQMLNIWTAADGFEIEQTAFSERILAQSLFMESLPEGIFRVFASYYETGLNKRLIRAFLKYAAYRYLVRKQTLPEELFAYFYKEVRVEENRHCLLAVLEHMSQKEVLSEEEAAFAEYNIHKLYEKNCVLPFFQKFAGKITLPEGISREQYICITADPACTVKLDYRIFTQEGEITHTKETMRDVFEGIRVKSVVLFRDETLEYSLQEQREDGSVQNSPTQQLTCQQPDGKQNGWYQYLNDMMESLAEQEDAQVLEQMREYTYKKETVRSIFAQK